MPASDTKARRAFLTRTIAGAATLAASSLPVRGSSGIEQSGGDFSAGMAGKLKMVVQCIAAAASLFTLHFLAMHPAGHAVPPWLHWTLVVSVWGAIVLTIYSGVEYIFAAAKYFK